MKRGQPAADTSSSPTRLIDTLARDPFVLSALLLLPLIAVVNAAPLLEGVAEVLSAFDVPTIAWVLLVVAAIFSGLRRVQKPAERRFWARLGSAFTCWALADVLYASGAFDPNRLIGSVGQDALYLLYYLGWILALEARPDVEGEQGRREDWRDFTWAGRVLFATGLFAYAILLPRALQPGEYLTWVPSFLFFVALDLYLVARVAARWRRSDSPRWRIHYGLLSLSMLLVAFTDVLDLMSVAGRIELPSPGLGDARWFAPMLLVVIAARARTHPFSGPDAGPGAHEERDPTGVRLLAYAFALPILHLAYYQFVETLPELRTARELFVLLWMFVLGVPSLVHHLRLEARRRQAEEQLRLSEQRYRRTLEAAPNSISIARQSDGLILQVSGHFTKMLGYSREEAIGRTPFDLNLFVHPEDRDRLIGILEDEGEVNELEVQYRRKDGTTIDTLLSARPLRYEGEDCLVAVVTDISARARAEEDRLALERQLLHAQKLESLGVLAGGIAHDFNNLLVGIMGNAELARLKLPPDSAIRKRIEGIATAATRAGELCKQMLAYSGKGRFVVEPVNLSTLTEEMVDLLEVAVSTKSRLDLDLARDLPLVEADATQLRQIVMNLVTNASEAIGSGGGHISVTTGVVHCDESYFARASPGGDLPAGRYVFLEVADSGCGMDPETAGRIFDPFFSTKFSGRGLGLAAVLGIVSSHDGAIRVDSTPDRGTTIRVLLPPSRRDAARPPEARPEGEAWSGSGTVLLVDDDEHARSATAPMLKALGFGVLTAADGNEALDVFVGHRGEISLVLLDMTMPGMGGEETYVAMRRRGLTAPVVLATGHHEQDATSRFRSEGLSGFLQKPFTLTTLRETLRQALKSAPTPWADPSGDSGADST